MNWPAKSPNLNPIENLWKVVKARIGPIKARKNEAGIREKIKSG